MALPLLAFFLMLRDVSMMPVYICLTCVVMNGNTLSAWKIRMTHFTETVRKVVTKSLHDKQNQPQESMAW
jgi:hypothetical protein